MKVLVTGGAGFIGSHLARALIERGDQVTLFDNFSTGKRENIDDIQSEIDLIEGDIREFSLIAAAAKGCDVIFHQAALVSVPVSIKDPLLNHTINVSGTNNVLEAARLGGVKRVVYASSAAVYGDLPNLPKREEDALGLISPYAAAKYMNEVMAQNYTQVYGLETIGLRYMNVFGPYQDPSSPYSGVLSIFVKAAKTDGRCKIYGDGEQTRDFIFVSDVVEANLRASNLLTDHFPKSPIFNVGSGKQISLNQIVKIINELRGEPMSVAYESARPGDIRHSVADIKKARQFLGFQPSVDISTGLRSTFEWVG